jgi:mono/diheme cytochrome c family protein
MRRALAVLLALLPLLALSVAASQRGAPPPPGSREGGRMAAMVEPGARLHTPGHDYVSSLIEGASDQVAAGAHTYHLVCEACHGASGLGLAEGRESFPPTHQRCERCHRDTNSALWDQTAITPRNSFALGDPPALRGPGTLAKLPNALVLHAYVQAAMPRYRPGVLDDQQYLDLTAFLMVLHGDLPKSAVIDLAAAADLPIGHGDASP